MKTNVKTLVANVVMEWMLLDATLHWLSISHDLHCLTLLYTSSLCLPFRLNQTFTYFVHSSKFTQVLLYTPFCLLVYTWRGEIKFCNFMAT